MSVGTAQAVSGGETFKEEGVAISSGGQVRCRLKRVFGDAGIRKRLKY